MKLRLTYYHNMLVGPMLSGFDPVVIPNGTGIGRVETYQHHILTGNIFPSLTCPEHVVIPRLHIQTQHITSISYIRSVQL